MSRTRRTAPRRIRVATYNILLGGERRRDLVRNVLRRVDADVIALQEVHEVDRAGDLARELDMEMFLGEPSDPASPMHTAILTRLPVRAWRNRRHHGRMLRSHLHCDIETGGTELPLIGVHCLHLAARFGDRNKGEARRIREIGAVLTDIADEPALPHMLIGDFNALSPGDDILATSFFRRMNDLRRAGLLVAGPNGILVPLAPDANGSDDGLADPTGESRQVEPFAFRHLFRDWNAEVVAAGALRLHFEFVDAREVGLPDPQILRVGLDFVEGDGAFAVEDGGGRCRGRSERRAGPVPGGLALLMGVRRTSGARAARGATGSSTRNSRRICR